MNVKIFDIPRSTLNHVSKQAKGRKMLYTRFVIYFFDKEDTFLNICCLNTEIN